MRARNQRAATALLILLLAGPPSNLADVVHLKNGGTIEADAWEEREGMLVIHQGGATISVPLGDVVRIEPSERTAPATGTLAGRNEVSSEGEGPSPSSTREGIAAPSLPLDETGIDKVLGSIAELKRRIDRFPMAREENTRQVVALLTLLGSERLRQRNFEDAMAKFREALMYDEHHPAAQLGLAASHFGLEENLHALSILERAVLEHPDDARLRTLLGDVYERQERPEDALAAWEKALMIKPDAAVESRIAKLRREHSVERSYRRSEALHFMLKYDGERAGSDLDSEILDYLEEEFPKLVDRFEYYPREPIVVIVYPSRQFYEATEAGSNVGGLYDGKIRVPSGGLKRLNSEARSVLLHELAHAFVAGKSRGAAPRWLHEGIAQMIEGLRSPAAVERSLAIDYQAAENQEIWNPPFSYPSALSFVEYLDRREGFYRLVDVLEWLAAGETTETAFQRATHYSLQELRQAWGAALALEHLQ